MIKNTLSKIKLRTWISMGIIVVLSPILFAAAYGILGALGGSNATPIAHWAFDEGADNTCSGGSNDACDSTGNGNDGAISGAVWQTEDKCVSGKCLFFDGTNDTVSLPSNMLDSYSTGSVCTWFRWTVASDGGSEYHMFSYADSAGTQNKANFYISDSSSDDANLVFFLRTTTGNDVLIKTSNQAVRRNSWQHTCVTQGGAGLALYLDGNPAQATTTTNGTGTANDWFATIASGAENASISGTIDDSPGQFFQGFMDEVKVFDSALTSAQIKAEYAGGAAVLGSQNTDFLNEGLVGYWPMDDNVSGDAESIADESGNGRTGTTVDGANDTGMDCATGGKFGGSCEFDGTDDYISASAALGITNQVSIAAWFNTDTLTSTGLRNIYTSNLGGTYLGLVTSGTSAPHFSLMIDGTQRQLNTSSTFTPSVDTWYHVVASYDGNYMRIFVNGELKATSDQYTGTVTGFSSTGFIGAWTNSGFEFDGMIDELRIYNRGLTGAEARALYNWAPGPVGYWNFDEGSGTTAFDKSSTGLNGTLESSASWNNGKFGKAVYLNGSSDYISYSGLPTTQLDNWTMSAWIKPEDLATLQIAVSNGTDDGETGDGYGFGVNNDGSLVGVFSGVSFIDSGYTYPTANQWYHVTMLRDNGTTKFYVNGIQTSDTSSAVPTTPTDFTIGSQTGIRFFDGAIDEVRVYNYARTSQQIVEDMNAGHPTGGSPIGSQLHYWNLDEMQGDTASDSLGSNNADLGNSDTTCPTSGADCPTWTSSGKINSALSFDGGDLAVLSAVPTVTVSGNYSISLWFYTSVTSGNQTLINLSNGSSDRHGINIENSTIRGGYYNGSTYTGKSGTFTASQWNHVVLTNNSGTVNLYLNGNRLTGTSLGSLGTSSPANTLGFTSNGNFYFTGMIDEVKVYSSALTEDQIKIDMNAGASNNFGTGADEKADLAGGAGDPPIGYWNLDEKVSGDGQTIFNKSGNANGTTVDGANNTGMDCTVSGKYGSACQFDGIDDYLDLGDIANSNTISWSFWVNPTTLSTTQRILDKFNTSGSNREWRIYLDTSNNLVLQASSDGDNNESQTASTNSLTANQWTHFAVIYNNGSFDVYQNGRLLSDDGDFSTVTSIANTSTSIRAGEGYVTSPYSGRLDEVKIYDYALSQAQVAYEFNRGAPIGWWQFDECTGSTANDAMGIAGNGTITPGASGNTSVGDCGSGTSTEMWNDGTTGKINGSLGFDGTDDYVIVSSPTLPTGDFTIALWFKGTTVGNETLFHVPNAANGNELQIKSALQVQLFTNGSQTVTGGTTLSAGSWYHLAATRSGSNLTVYVNGKADGTGTDGTAFDFSTCAIYIGSDFGCGSTQANPAEGQIDDVRLYNYALSAEQIQKVMLGGSAVGAGASFGPSQGSP